MSINKKQLIFSICSLLIALLLTGLGKNVLFCLVIFLWANMVFYSVQNLTDRSVLFGFLITFFLFLLGREFLQVFFNYEVELFDESVNNHSYIVYIIALLSLCIIYTISMKGRDKSRYIDVQLCRNERVENISRMMFLMFILFSIASKLVVVRFVSNFSYYEYYTDYSSYASGNIVVTVLNLIERMMPVILCCFLACFPSKEKAKLPLSMYLVYLIISLGTQARSTAMLGLLFILIYFLYRQALDPSEKWLNKKIIIIFIIGVPALAVIGSIINDMREGYNGLIN